jgi:cyanophycin synthetase
MKILDIKVMRGPNYWSIYRKKLIVMKLDLQELEERPTDEIEGFTERLVQLMPGLEEHHCSPGVRGGFIQRLKKGTWMGHVVEHIALELQSLAGMDCGFGRTRPASQKGVYHVVFSYQFEEAGKLAAKQAVELAEAVIRNQSFCLNGAIYDLARICRRERFGPTTQSVVDEAELRKISWTRINRGSMIMFGQGCNQKMICASIASTTSNIGVDLAGDKEDTKRILGEAYIPVPRGFVISTPEELNDAIHDLDFPLVIKPVNGNHGRGVTTNILTHDMAATAFSLAKTISDEIIVERFVTGQDYRFLVINYKLVAVAKRTPAMIIGDGKSSIGELIDEVNKDPRRGDGHEKILTKIVVDEVTKNILSEKRLSLQSVLPLGEILFLKDTANISTGGTARDVTDLVHPYNVLMAERISRLLNLDICGVDIIATDINAPITEKSGAVLEVNAGPGFRMHLAPAKGIARNVAAPVIDMLFPGNAPSRIPVIAVTGTNGKTTTVRLIAHLATHNGKSVGYTTTEGIYIRNHAVFYGDCSGPASARAVLRDPIVDFAVLECARGGILRAGLGFDQCDIGIVTNVSSDHLGLEDIDTLEKLAKVKAVVPNSVHKQGYAILNADDDRVYEMRRELDCEYALFSMDAENERIKKHCAKKGIAAVVEKNYIVLCRGKWKTRIAKISDVPLTFSGTAECMIKNILPSVLAAALSGFSAEKIAEGLKTFIPSPETTPGRMNLFKFRDFRIMVDYAHNEDGFIELKKYISQVKSPLKIGVIGGTGDRRDEDLRKVGMYAAQMFDEIIIRTDKDTRGRNPEEINNLLLEGIRSVNENTPVKIIPEETEAIYYAISQAVKDAFILAFADHVMDTIAFVRDLQEKEKTQPIQSLLPVKLHH